MQRNARGQILTGELVTDEAKAFYVSVISPDGRDYRLVLGPFPTEPEARKHVDTVRRYMADKNYKDHHWMAYGTSGYTGADTPPQGLFNAALLEATA